MRHLRRMNVHHASLFPDLIGASDYSNLIVAEEWREYEIEEAAQRKEKADLTGSINKIEPTENTEWETIIEGNEEVVEIAAILLASSEEQVEPGRIQIMAEKLTQDLPSHQVVDWVSRESAVSSMRASIRIMLRRYGYPAINRDTVVDEIIEYQKIKYSDNDR